MTGINPAIQGPVSPQRAVDATGSSPETPAHHKLRKAAQEFEGMLISQLWGTFQAGFSSLTGDAPMAGSDTLNSLALQTLSTGLAARGGLGIARMMVDQLEPSLGQTNRGARRTIKNPYTTDFPTGTRDAKAGSSGQVR
jgi:Rod binding domain-containing protein